MFERGQIVECIEKPGYLDGFKRGGEYVVNAVERHRGWDYIQILGDDGRGRTLLASMFRPIQTADRRD